MFDSVACCRMHLATVPTVSCAALLDLKALLRCASFRKVMLCYKVSIDPCQAASSSSIQTSPAARRSDIQPHVNATLAQ
jgi:hypothetical protein